ncbi:LamG-like jellyroll fold domain-containing protein [Microbacterium sp. RURRCA19A]|uniref:LamG-like jellyroll fold domain-containing protein n=1 Tax=Microbacterium sp. RURRCA19A TaxID=1907391 RepID=UPI0009560A25|nr:LamG-like jellyroll fold domain-containing protein [Microbacterium sp. RURRCA19A]SIR91691.1 Fibronectin type III domain-containing protein [Microbacterium sp. RURRCA19A]
MRPHTPAPRRVPAAVAACVTVPLVIGLVGAPAAFAAPDDTPPRPIVEYTFDGDPSASVIANEGSKGSAFDARVRNATSLARGTGPTSGAGASGLFPGAAQGSSSSATPYLDIPAGLFDGVTALTVSTWIKWDGKNAGNLPWAYIIGSDALPSDNWGLYFQPNEGGQSKAVANSGTEVKAVSPVPLTAGAWAQITSVADGQTLSYYINGELVRREAAEVDFAKLGAESSTRSGLIGRVPWAPQWAALFGGEFDDFSIYDVALTSDQVAQDFAATAGAVTALDQTAWQVQTTAGQAPALPARVGVTRESGLKTDAAVRWDAVSASQYATAGATFVVNGAVEGTDRTVTATVTVGVRPTEEIVADLSRRTGDFRGGASGTLYGLGDEQSPTQALVNGAAMTNVSQKPPFGTQHPGGDAFDIEKTFFDKHGEDLYIYTQDYYPDWPYNRGVRPGDDRTYVRDANGTLTSEWTPGGDGVWDYLEVLEIVTEAVATGADDPEKYTFIPFNELDLQWLNTDDKYNRYLLQGGQSDSFTPGGASDWAAAWKVITDVYAKHGLSRPRIAGPGDAAWRGEGNITAFLRAAIATNTVPDVYVWHELRGYQWMPDRASAFRQYARDLGIAEDKIPQINITEYGASNDMSSPANLLRWFSSFEAAKIDAQTAYWTASGTLSDNQAKVNAANGGWWMFKWYGDLQGSQTAEVTANREKAIAAIDDANRRAQVLVGGVEQGRDGLLTVKGLSNDTFGGKVDIEVREDLISGTDGVADTPRVVAAYDDVAVSGGSVQVRIPSANASAAYQVIITPATDRDVAAEAAQQAPHQWSEAENLAITGGVVRSQPGGGYRLSGDHDVTGLTGADARLDWEVDVAQPGLYRYTVLAATPGRAAQHALFVDGNDSATVQYGANAIKPDNVRGTARGTAEVYVKLDAGTHTLSLRTSRDGQNVLPGAGADGGVTVDRVELTRVGDDTNTQHTVYPATALRLAGDAKLDAGAVSIGDGDRVDVYPSAEESGYYDVVVDWTGADLGLTVNGRLATTFTEGQKRARIHLPEGISEVELRSTGGARVSAVSTTRAVEGDAAIVKVEVEDPTKATLGGTAAVKGFGSDLTNGTGTGYVGGLGITDAIAANQGTLTIPRGAGFDTAGAYDAIVHYSNDDIEGRHDYNPQVVDLGLQAQEAGHDGLVGRSTFRYTYTATNFWEAVMPLNLTTADGAVTFGNTRHTIVIDERTSQQDQVVLDGYAIAPDVDWIAFAPFVLETDGVEIGVPAAPAAPSVGVDGTSATVSWQAPADNGSAITGYTLDLVSDGGATRSVAVDATGDPTAKAALSATVADLAPGTWTARVTAINAVGASPASEASAPFVIAEAAGPGEPTPTPTPTPTESGSGSGTGSGAGTGSTTTTATGGALAVTGTVFPLAALFLAVAGIGAGVILRRRAQSSRDGRTED